MSEPTTEAGKAVFEEVYAIIDGEWGCDEFCVSGWEEKIAAIEAEAVAAERARLTAAVERLRNPYRHHGGVGQGSAYGSGWEECHIAVLALLEPDA